MTSLKSQNVIFIQDPFTAKNSNKTTWCERKSFITVFLPDALLSAEKSRNRRTDRSVSVRVLPTHNSV